MMTVPDVEKYCVPDVESVPGVRDVEKCCVPDVESIVVLMLKSIVFLMLKVLCSLC